MESSDIPTDPLIIDEKSSVQKTTSQQSAPSNAKNVLTKHDKKTQHKAKSRQKRSYTKRVISRKDTNERIKQSRNLIKKGFDVCYALEEFVKASHMGNCKCSIRKE